MILPRAARLSAFLLGVVHYRCPRRHAGEEGLQIEFDFDALTVPGFQALVSSALAGFSAACGACRQPVGRDGIARAIFFHAFEDRAGTVVVWFDGASERFRVAYSAETQPEALVRRRPEKLADLAPREFSVLQNDDCKAVLGRVFSLRTRWRELAARFAQGGRTVVDTVAPGLAFTVHEPSRAAEVGAILKVLVPDFDLAERHSLLPVDEGTLEPDVAETVRTHEARLLVLADRNTAYAEAIAAAARGGLRVETRERSFLVNRDGLEIEFSVDDLVAEAARRGRTLGEQAVIGLGASVAALRRAERVADVLRERGPVVLSPEWTVRVGDRPAEPFLPVVEACDPETEEGRARLDRWRSP